MCQLWKRSKTQRVVRPRVLIQNAWMSEDIQAFSDPVKILLTHLIFGWSKEMGNVGTSEGLWVGFTGSWLRPDQLLTRVSLVRRLLVTRCIKL